MRKLFFILFILATFISVKNARAASVRVDINNIRYTVDDEAMTAEVYGPVSSSTIITNLIIPDYISYSNKSIPVVSIRDMAFWLDKNLRGSLTIGDNVQTIGEAAFSNCTGFTGSLTIGDNVQTIGEQAFVGCSGFTGSLTIGDNVQSIGNMAFWFCSGFTGSLTIPNSVQTIGDRAFSDCENFTGELIIPESVKEIGSSCFASCDKLTSLVITSSNTIINYMAFVNCGGLNSITCLSTTPPRCVYGWSGSNYYDYVFGGIMYNIPLYVPAESVNLYKNATEWEKFKYINPISVEATAISLNKDELNLIIGQEETLIATLTPEDATTEIVWSSDNNIISIDQSGKVTALAVGEATVKATAGDVSATCKVIVKPVMASGVTLNVQDMTLLVGQTDKLIATVTPENTTDKTITWKSDNEAVATVGIDGTVTAISVGVANITATCGEVSATCKVTVNPILATSISIDGGNIHILKQTETLQLTAIVIPEDATSQEIIWSSSDDSKATVSTSGLVTAIEEGNVEIKATLTNQQEVSASYAITIQKRILGDANDNGIVNVADVGTISDYIVEKPVYNFCFVNADVITDGKITTADVTATVDIIFNDTPSMAKFAKARKIYATDNNELIVDNFNSSASSIVNVNLKNPSEFTGLQGSIIIPEGVTVRNVKKGAGVSNHILNFNVTDHGTVEFILYSLQNATFDGMGSLIELEIQAGRNSDDIIVENILASDSAANEYSLSFTGGKNNDLITSLKSVDNANIQIYSSSQGVVILNAQGENVNIFNIAGERIISERVKSNKEFYPLASGLYIVTVKTETAKLIVK